MEIITENEWVSAIHQFLYTQDTVFGQTMLVKKCYVSQNIHYYYIIAKTHGFERMKQVKSFSKIPLRFDYCFSTLFTIHEETTP